MSTGGLEQGVVSPCRIIRIMTHQVTLNNYGSKYQTLTLIQGEGGLRQEPVGDLGGRGPLQPHLGLRLRGPLRRRAEAAPQDPRVTAQPAADGGAPQGTQCIGNTCDIW